ncbi:hypothetical protein [Streptomyces sp. cg35]|uniref:hypothetical protein n=1 Tax=Streptomyces sp. cg35 TaxID=3421650 RepID=UPI003D184E48
MTQGELPVTNGIVAGIWIRDGKDYYYCRGATTNGQPRLAQLHQLPYGKTVYSYDGTTWSSEHVPFRLRPATIFWLGAIAALILLLSAALSGQDPILLKFAIPIVLIVGAIAATVAQTGPLYPDDAISAAEARQAAYEAQQEADRHRAENYARQQARQAQQMLGWQAAIWAQNAATTQALHPGQDTYRPYGQSPPL